MSHASIDQLRGLVQDRLGSEERRGLATHLETCPACREMRDTVEAALALSAVAYGPVGAAAPEGLDAEEAPRPLAGNDARLEAALRARRPGSVGAPRRPRPVSTWLVGGLAAGLAAAALLLVVLPLQPDAAPGDGPAARPAVAFTVEGSSGALRGPAQAPRGVVQADAFSAVAPGQSVRLQVDAPAGGWVYVVALGEGLAQLMPGLPDEGLPLPAGGHAVVPAAHLPPWRPAGEPGDLSLAVIISPQVLEAAPLLAAAQSASPFAALETLSGGTVLRAVLRFGGEEVP